MQVSRIVYWTDSTIVLHWIKFLPQTLKIVDANRVAEIQTEANIANWRHVPTTDNSAELILRGETFKEFLRPTIWKNESEWLQQNEEHWSTWRPTPLVDVPDRKRLSTKPLNYSLLERYPSWSKLMRIVLVTLVNLGTQLTSTTTTDHSFWNTDTMAHESLSFTTFWRLVRSRGKVI